MIKKLHHIRLALSGEEKAGLRKHKVKIADIPNFTVDALMEMMGVTPARAKLIFALADFQSIPSVGIKFAEDLVFLGYYSVASLSGKEGSQLLDEFERKKGYRTDPCVEDQFRLAVHFANTKDYSKNWWDFTAVRKAYRAREGYPESRPAINWYDVAQR